MIVAQSTTETEFMAMGLGYKELLWVENILNELKMIKEVSSIYCHYLGSFKIAR